MAKMIAKKKKSVLVEDEDEVVPESPIHDHDMTISSPNRDSPIKSNVEVTGDLDGCVKIFHVDTTINQGDHSKESTPVKTNVIPLGFSNVESVTEEVRTLGIPMKISNIDTNVIMVKGVLNNEA
ncbi:unnamed protein product [Lactuca saligna]|uniref:Uncharacterized protein n=1 Tax=Lactuca saligna TaxID=75948 RepID=A0AA35YUW2_LACSI|nr:unnamed protein product [Lactuca saligna]